MTFSIAKSTSHSFHLQNLYVALRRKQLDAVREAGSGPSVPCAGITPAEETSVVARLGMRYRRGTNS
jgi:hypothetical protein